MEPASAVAALVVRETMALRILSVSQQIFARGAYPLVFPIRLVFREDDELPNRPPILFSIEPTRIVPSPITLFSENPRYDPNPHDV
jgi:hypothetical protein